MRFSKTEKPFFVVVVAFSILRTDIHRETNTMPHTNEQIAHDFAIAIAAQNYTKSSVRNIGYALDDYDQIYHQVLEPLALTHHIAV